MKKLIKLMPDYQCYPLWEYDEFGLVANLNPKDLPISKVFSIIKFFKVERKLSRKKLYSLFCAEEYEYRNELVLKVDSTLKTIYEIYSYFGEKIYNRYQYINTILPENRTYFGASPDGFSDCLTEFLDQLINSDLLRIEIISKGEEISDSEIYMFLYILSINMVNYNYESKLRVFVSKEILDIYLKESKRLLDLDTHSDNFVVY
ncbi:hypothetical protein RFH95_09680 [Acinetobacter nosocomialis]|uniref:hypothetical protein n=1 Tax=Acinetobacter nosocomialis TaxID=106654 RepID=UPI000B55D514|nr:hypothetical protein [Acinetobacter nosocomialis]MDQ9040700.1 hypothetical protein [Acinetobacter nosocomialis]MDR9530881.1 hypothetical protein [Acinetobacter nosocomialis]OUT27128.1 hypothetical protein H125_08467 [Acinetobacter nosocomialis P020]